MLKKIILILSSAVLAGLALFAYLNNSPVEDTGEYTKKPVTTAKDAPAIAPSSESKDSSPDSQSQKNTFFDEGELDKSGEDMIDVPYVERKEDTSSNKDSSKAKKAASNSKKQVQQKKANTSIQAQDEEESSTDTEEGGGEEQ